MSDVISRHAERWLGTKLLLEIQDQLKLGAWAARYDAQCPESVIFVNDAVMISQERSPLMGGADITFRVDDWDAPKLATAYIENPAVLVSEKHFVDALDILEILPARIDFAIRDEYAAEYLVFRRSKIIPPIRHDKSKQFSFKQQGRVIRSV